MEIWICLDGRLLTARDLDDLSEIALGQEVLEYRAQAPGRDHRRWLSGRFDRLDIEMVEIVDLLECIEVDAVDPLENATVGGTIRRGPQAQKVIDRDRPPFCFDPSQEGTRGLEQRIQPEDELAAHDRFVFVAVTDQLHRLSKRLQDSLFDVGRQRSVALIAHRGGWFGDCTRSADVMRANLGSSQSDFGGDPEGIVADSREPAPRAQRTGCGSLWPTAGRERRVVRPLCSDRKDGQP